jgi:hypothetical protein
MVYRPVTHEPGRILANPALRSSAYLVIATPPPVPPSPAASPTTSLVSTALATN